MTGSVSSPNMTCIVQVVGFYSLLPEVSPKHSLQKTLKYFHLSKQTATGNASVSRSSE